VVKRAGLTGMSCVHIPITTVLNFSQAYAMCKVGVKQLHLGFPKTTNFQRVFKAWNKWYHVAICYRNFKNCYPTPHLTSKIEISYTAWLIRQYCTNYHQPGLGKVGEHWKSINKLCQVPLYCSMLWYSLWKAVFDQLSTPPNPCYFGGKILNF
jgi:hypothetical protein